MNGMLVNVRLSCHGTLNQQQALSLCQHFPAHEIAALSGEVHDTKSAVMCWRSSFCKSGSAERISGSIAFPVGPSNSMADLLFGAACLGGSDSVIAGSAACS